MGDEVLIKNMKKIIVLPLLITCLNAEDSRLAMVSEYQNMFSRIGQKRVGVDPRVIDSLRTPFVEVKKAKAKVKTKVVNGEIVAPMPSFLLQAIVNKKAKISGRWYGINDEVSGLKLVSIRNGVVWLRSSDYKKRLTMRKENAKISIK